MSKVSGYLPGRANPEGGTSPGVSGESGIAIQWSAEEEALGGSLVWWWAAASVPS